MASRTKQKEEARARRLAEEQARAERDQRRRRLQMLLGVIVAAVAVVAVAIAVSAGGSSSPSAGSASGKRAAAQVRALLAGIPQAGNTLGRPGAKVTVTEFGDLQCPVCRDFALGAENNLISNDVRAGRVKLTYRSLDTATGNSPNPGVFATQQAAALAAGRQNHAWDYILLFYHQQGAEGTDYVNSSFLEGLARQIPGLNLVQWNADRNSPILTAQVTGDQQAASAKGYNSTPTVVVQGPKGTAKPIVGNTDYVSLLSAIKSVQ